MKKILPLILIILPITQLSARESDRFISASGRNYSEARTSAVKIAQQQGLRVVNYNYTIDRTGNCNIVIRASAYKPRYYIYNNVYTNNRKLAIAIENNRRQVLRSTPLPGTNYRPRVK